MAEMNGELTAAVTLPEFLSTHEVGTLTVADRQLIVEQALLVLEQTYALLPFKAARYGINPLQRLRLMQTRLGRPGSPGPEWQFHAELVDILIRCATCTLGTHCRRRSRRPPRCCRSCSRSSPRTDGAALWSGSGSPTRASCTRAFSSGSSDALERGAHRACGRPCR